MSDIPTIRDQDWTCGCAVRRNGALLYACLAHMRMIEALPRPKAMEPNGVNPALCGLAELSVLRASDLPDGERAHGMTMLIPSYGHEFDVYAILRGVGGY